jgi:GTP diphosphokinase / guanosine-3',5'-bis(diphosphate) 3'-diphosphatase
MHEKELIEFCKQKDYTTEQIEMFLKALKIAQRELKDKKRLSGGSFYQHHLNVGIILIDNRSLPEVVVAGILHGLLNLETEIKTTFNEEVFSLVSGVEEIKKIKQQNKKLEAEALRKILLTTLKDVRVILIKLANKVDNLRSIGSLPEKEQKRISQEVLDIYAPLAYRLGVEKIKVQLEDAALKNLRPRKYREIYNFLQESQEIRENNIHEILDIIKNISKDKVEIVKIKGRPKHIYSIFKKIVNRGVKLHHQYDHLGIRILVPKIKDCYTMLGLLHEHFEPIEDGLRDYVANPKPNFYRSIHTRLLLKNGKRLEVQIRTPEMDEFAEEGIAAHWRYKGVASEQSFEKKVGWLKGILDLQKEGDTKEFLESAKVDIFGDSIYCYTPKGDVKELPKDATVLDFAYSVHEQVGNHTVGARVNGKFVPLRYTLKQGDIIEVLTNKNQRPRRTWIKIVVSGKSRQKIRKSLREFENLPAFIYRRFKPQTKEELGVLTESEEFPNAICSLAKCCHPLPGDDIIGIITKKRTISVHLNECKQALKEENRWVPVNWKDSFNQKIRFYVTVQERSGVLAELLHTIARAGFEVKEAKAKLIDMENAECSFLIIPRDLDTLIDLIKRIMNVRSVKKINFE